MRRTYLGLSAAALLAALAVPSAASAAVRLVDKAGADNPSCVAATPCLTIGHAVSVANASDTVRIGPGFYDEAVVADETLHFEGAGAGDPGSLFTPGTTRVQPLVDDGPAIELRDGGSVRDLQLVGKANASPANRPGLLLTTPVAGSPLAYVVERVHAFGGETGSSTRKEGIRIDDAGTGRELKAEVNDLVLAPGATNDGSDGLIADGPEVTAQLDGVTVRPLSDIVRFPLWSQHGARLELTDTTMEPTGQVNIGLYVQDAPGSTLVKRSDLRANGQVLLVHNGTFGAATAVVDDSVLANVSGAPTDPSQRATAQTETFGAGDARLFFRNATVLGRRAQPQGLLLISAGAGDALAQASNSIFRATSTTGQSAADVRLVPGNGKASFQPSHSSFSEAVSEPPTGAGAGLAPAPGVDTNLAGDPAFVDEAGGNLRLGAGSPLVDRGDPTVVVPLGRDLTGGPRTIDGDGDGVATPDMGAYERGFIPGPGGDGGGATGGGTSEGAGVTAVPGAPTGVPAAAGVRVLSFALSRSRFRVGRNPTALAAAKRRRTAAGTEFRFALSTAATASIAIARTLPGTKRRAGTCARPRRGGRRCKRSVAIGTLTREAKTGPVSVPFSGRLGRRALKPGSYTATLAAAGADGARSAGRTIAFRVVRG